MAFDFALKKPSVLNIDDCFLSDRMADYQYLNIIRDINFLSGINDFLSI